MSTRPKCSVMPVGLSVPLPVLSLITVTAPPKTTWVPRVTLKKFTVVVPLVPLAVSRPAWQFTVEQSKRTSTAEPLCALNDPVFSWLVVAAGPCARSTIPVAWLLKAPVIVETPVATTNPLLLVVISPIVPPAREILPPLALVSVVMPVNELASTSSVLPELFANVLLVTNGPVTRKPPAFVIAPFTSPAAFTSPLFASPPLVASSVPVVTSVPVLEFVKPADVVVQVPELTTVPVLVASPFQVPALFTPPELLNEAVTVALARTAIAPLLVIPSVTDRLPPVPIPTWTVPALVRGPTSEYLPVSVTTKSEVSVELLNVPLLVTVPVTTKLPPAPFVIAPLIAPPFAFTVPVFVSPPLVASSRPVVTSAPEFVKPADVVV